MKGWEYPAALTIKQKLISEKDNIYLSAHSIGSRVFVFFKSEGSLWAGQFSNQKLHNIKKIAKLDMKTDPVIKKHLSRIYILTYHKEKNTIYSFDEMMRLNEFYHVNNRYNFNYNFFPFDNIFIFSKPQIISNKYTIQLDAIIKAGKAYQRKHLAFPRIKEDEKGYFFPRIIKKNNMYKFFFLARYTRKEKESSNVIREKFYDSIYTFSVSNVLDIDKARPQKIITSGFSDYPPLYFIYQNQDYICFPSKKATLYQIKLLALQDRIEYDISPSFVNAYKVQIFRNPGSVGFYFITHTSDKAQISYRNIDLDKIYNFQYMKTNKTRNLTDPDLAFHNYSITESDKMKYIFFIPDRKNIIYYSREDHFAPVPHVQKKIIKEEYDQSNNIFYPRFSWREPDDPSRIAAYASIIDRDKNTVPLYVNHSQKERYKEAANIEPGRYYFHLRAVDNLRNFSKTRHIPFTVYTKKKPKRLPREERERLAMLRLQEEMEKQEALRKKLAYPVYLDYIKKAMTSVKQKEYFLAEENINLAAVILPERIESYILLQNIEKKRSRFFYQYKIHLFIAFFILFWTSGLMFFLKITRR
ncbi:MAG TPA: hypothetical protein VKS21_08865 [Spirochaetota bacterium]|nr:hypothetical protein [Spirochaetota bacterium]